MNAARETGMEPERWRQVEALYHEMLARPAHERAAALLAACADDVSLLSDVQSLLDQPESAAGVLATPPAEVVAGLVSEPGPSLTGQQIGTFEVMGLLGVGGMGEVYRARDTRLGREVAIKVLPEVFARDEERLARFEREARALGSLSHPNILAVYEVGKHASTPFLVSELLEGRTLQEVMARGALPLRKTVDYAAQIAQGLAAAHEKGIVHRDLKPANLWLTTDGRIKILDFGLARGTEGSGPETLGEKSGGGPAVTGAGSVLGTPGYMAPEQVRGEPADHRADIFSFGVVLYEMLTGHRAFQRDTTPATLAAIQDADPPSWPGDGSAQSLRLLRLAQRCLEKQPQARFQSARDLSLVLAGESSDASIELASLPGRRRSYLPAAALAGIAVGGALIFAILRSTADPRARTVTRFTLSVADGAGRFLGGQPDALLGRPSATSLALSPEGTALVYSASEAPAGGRLASRLYMRRWDQERGVPIAGSEGGAGPFFSPKGDWIGFFVGQALRRVPTDGGAIETIVPDAGLARGGPRGAAWGDDGTIVYGGDLGLYRVAASGGSAKLVAGAAASRKFFRYVQPSLLPGSRVVLFHGMRTFDPAKAEVLSMDLTTGAVKSILTDAMDPRYVATGHLLFMRRGRLMAVPFDADRLEVRGTPVTILDDVAQAIAVPAPSQESGAGQWAVSAAGHLAYATGALYPPLPSVVMRLTRNGKATAVGVESREYASIRVSPDGNRLALFGRNGPGTGAYGLYVHDLARGVTQKLSTGGFLNWWAIWSPDGRSIAFSSDRGGDVFNIYRMPLDGSSEPERLAPSEQDQHVTSWSSQGVIAYIEKGDIWTVHPPDAPRPFFRSDATEMYATFSPDGRWLAYASSSTGRTEVYVRPYPGPGVAIQVSGSGGSAPSWSLDGRRIYYTSRGAGTTLLAADVTPGDPFRAGRPHPLLDPWPSVGTGPGRSYDVLSDGSFLVCTLPEGGPLKPRFTVTEIHVVLNFFDELNRRDAN